MYKKIITTIVFWFSLQLYGENLTKLTLEKAIEYGLKNFEKIKSAKLNIELLENRLFLAKLSPFTKWTIEGYLAPTPERHGNAIYTAQSDTYFGGEWGIVTGIGIKGGIPINISRLWYLWRILETGIEIEKLKVESEKIKLIEKIYRLYFGLATAYKLKKLLKMAKEYLEKGERYVEEELEKESGEVTEIDRIKIKVYKEELEGRELELSSSILEAKEALKLLTGIKTDFKVADLNLGAEEIELGSIEKYIRLGLKKRLEIKLSELAKLILKRERRLLKAELFPDIVLGITADYGYSNVVDDQINPFVKDPYNYLSAGFGLVFKWDLDYTTKYAKLKENRIKQEKLELETSLLKKAIKTEIITSYKKLLESLKKVKRFNKARRYARGWTTAIYQNIEAGVGEVKDLIDALKAYFEESINYYKSLYQLRINLLKFYIAIGKDSNEILKEMKEKLNRY